MTVEASPTDQLHNKRAIIQSTYNLMFKLMLASCCTNYKWFSTLTLRIISALALHMYPLVVPRYQHPDMVRVYVSFRFNLDVMTFRIGPCNVCAIFLVQEQQITTLLRCFKWFSLFRLKEIPIRKSKRTSRMKHIEGVVLHIHIKKRKKYIDHLLSYPFKITFHSRIDGS